MKVLQLAGLFVFLSCTTPSGLCGCSPPGGGQATIVGTVIDANRTPIQGASVWLALHHDAPCDPASPALSFGGFVPSGATGRFRHTAAWSGGNKCFALWAAPPAGSQLAASDTQMVNIDYRGATAVPDSVELTFTLRPK